MVIRKGYVDSRWGQLHYRETGGGPLPPLICLHATAYSGRTFEPLMPRLATGRRVIALDTPGYGGSDGPAAPIPFADYAAAIAETLPALVGDIAIDVFGYHTGALIGTELAAAFPAAIRRLVLVGIPYFDGLDRDAWRARLVHKHALTPAFEQFADRWEYFITGRTPGLSLERAYESFVDELGVYPRDWWAHDALFDYVAAPRLAAVRQQALVIVPTSALAPASRNAARVMPNATVLELPTLGGAPFDLGAALLAGPMIAFLAE